MRMPRNSGFTMLELSIVLIIIALVTTVGIATGMSVIESTKRSQTKGKLDIIEEALMVFRKNNHRLPCPSDLRLTKKEQGYGLEAGSPGACAGANFGTPGGIVEGAVPTKMLNLADDFMYDGWGRKINYAVESSATELEAFRAIAIPETCGITVNDASGLTRTTSAIYTLVSFGEDGHGGYLATGDRMKTGSLNEDVQTNCHCDAEANTLIFNPVYVQRDTFENPTDPKKSFGNIVRFKERWQMMVDDDQFTFAMGGSYTGPNIAAGFAMPAASSNSAYVYKMQCGKMLKQDDLNPLADESTTGVAFTPNNRYLVVFSDAGCVLYPITNGVIQTGVGTSLPNCPAYDSSIKLSMSANDFLAMTVPVAPYVLLWQRSGSSYISLNAPVPAPVSPITFLSLTANYLLLADTTSLTVYGRSSSAFIALLTQPASVPASIFSATISPNETYLAVTVDGNVSGAPAPQIQIWRITDTPSFDIEPVINIQSHDTPYSITFSPDGKYFVTGGTSGDNLAIYKIDKNDVFTRLATPTNWTNSIDTPGIAFAFSKDSRYLVMGTPNPSLPLVLFRRVSALEYKLHALPDSVQPYGVLSVGFNN